MEFQRLTYQDIVQDKALTAEERLADLSKLRKYSADSNSRSFAGNNYLYHYQMANLGKVRIEKKDSLYDKMTDDTKYQKLWDSMVKLNRTGTVANRLFEANRFNNAVVFFKPTTAMYLYKKYRATSILDPTAGWGGRMLGAWALGLPYVGYDTNTNLKPAYDAMLEELQDDKLKMNYESCLDADFSKIEYDFVLTSPPYINLELYENMTPFESKSMFYNKFLIPLLDKCLSDIKDGGLVAFNISPQMYSDLIKHGYRKCDLEEDLLQQKRLGKNKQDKIYLWRG